MKKAPIIAVVAALLLAFGLYFAPVSPGEDTSVSVGAETPASSAEKIDEAIAKVNSENPMEGIFMLKEILEKEPNNVKAIYAMGMLSVRSQQYEKAVARFKKLLELEPNRAEAHKILGDCYRALDDTEAALLSYQEFLKFSDNDEANIEVTALIKELKN